MRVVLERVSSASVTVDGRVIGEIDQGLLLLLGVHQNDTRECADSLALKCAELRIFPDADGKMNRSAKEVGGDALVVSQFTLYGDCSKGRRPNFMAAAAAPKATELYEYFVHVLRTQLRTVKTGVFGAMMDVKLVNHGPVTLILDSNAAEISASPSKPA
jgi:D-tyrosyl-tRNA(Tyr) deacylase